MENQLSENNKNNSATEEKLKQKGISGWVLFFIPAIIHIAMVFIGSFYDPCKNNAGCMAGSATAYFVILVTPIVLLILLVTTAVQKSGELKGTRKNLITNIILVIVLPIVLIVLVIIWVKAQ